MFALALLVNAAAAYVLFPGWNAVTKPGTLTMWLSPEFTRTEGAIIASAAAAWNEAIGEPAISLYWATKELDRDPGDQINAIYKTQRVGGDTTHYAALTTEGLILVDTDVRFSGALWGGSLFNVALHEFGHCLGLLHTDQPGIMAYSLSISPGGTPLPEKPWGLAPDDVAGAVSARRQTGVDLSADGV